MKNTLKAAVLLFMVVCVLQIATIVTKKEAKAVIEPSLSTTLNTSTYTAVNAGQINTGCRSFIAWTDDNTAFWLAADSSGTGAFKVPENTAYSEACVYDTAGVLFYVKAVSGTPTLYTRVVKYKN